MTATNMCYNFVGFWCSPPISEWKPAEGSARKRKVRVNPGHHQHHWDKAQNSGTVLPIPGRLATIGKVHFRAKRLISGESQNKRVLPV